MSILPGRDGKPSDWCTSGVPEVHSGMILSNAELLRRPPQQGQKPLSLW